MKIAILGYGEQGRSAYEYWRDGNDITVCDQYENLQLPEGVQAKLGPTHLHHLDGFDLIVRSPIVHPRDIVAANSPSILEKVTSNTNEFLRVCPTKNIVGVTGTKGKGTTSSLIAKMLEADGKTVHLGGNIGIPPLDLLKNNIQPDDWVVLELANFQLIDLTHSPHIGVCLMVVPEHLDWHPDTDEYYAAKSQLFRQQSADDFAIYNAQNENSTRIASTGKGWKVPFMTRPGAYVENNQLIVDDQPICHTDEIKLLGAHNWQNACAAVTAFWKISQNPAAARAVLTSFSGLEHRLELVREFDGVRYYDDSFGTTPETAIVAIQAFSQPKIVILGGSDKGADFTELARVVTEHSVRRVIVIGNATNETHPTVGPAIEAALRAQGFAAIISLVQPGGATMETIVYTAQQHAQPGDVVLLSAGCASFDMFKNYKDRGEQFKAAVRDLQ
ncbi:MAG TPA: UDP-N-acetylmuramoyl-L-alanine--D-glutamate ligase [Candidatus Saccharimonadales bacterium]|nr:UDP-N-acetylmuramoyl-L-alanine--D-glutamate ligase [Candidatus Saccharimonadales bacterium]